MAAFINAIYDEGTRKEALEWVHKLRKEKGMDALLDTDFDGWTKQDLCNELSKLYYGHD